MRIILADDEKAILDLESEIITSLGEEYQVVDRASNGLEALEMVRAQKPDILIADIRMPGLNGIQLIDQVKSQNPGIDTIVVSGYSDFEYVQQVLRLGAVDYLLKPLNRKELLDCFTRIQNRKASATVTEENFRNISSELQNSRESLYSRLMYDVITDEKADYVLKNNELDFSNINGNFRALVIKIDMDRTNNRPVIPDENMTRVIIDKFVRYFKQKGMDVRSLCLRSYGYLLVSEDPAAESIKLIQNELTNLITNSKYQYGMFDMTLGIGISCRNLVNVRETICTAEAAVQMRMDLGLGKVIFYENVPSALTGEEDIFTAQEKNRFERMLERADTKEMSDYLEDVLRTGAKNGKWHIYGLSEKLYHFASDYYSGIEGMPMISLSEDELTDHIENATTFFQLQEIIQADFEQLDHRYQEWVEKRDSKPVGQIKEFISAHYMENITLEEVAEQVRLSPAYVSSVFKKETGENFNSYLTNIRLEKAKELFKTANVTVAEAGEAVGYKDIRYFSKLFYKAYGVKPKDYKKFIHR